MKVLNVIKFMHAIKMNYMKKVDLIFFGKNLSDLHYQFKILTGSPYLFNFLNSVCICHNFCFKSLVFLQLSHLALKVGNFLEVVFIGHLELVVNPSFGLIMANKYKTYCNDKRVLNGLLVPC